MGGPHPLHSPFLNSISSNFFLSKTQHNPTQPHLSLFRRFRLQSPSPFLLFQSLFILRLNISFISIFLSFYLSCYLFFSFLLFINFSSSPQFPSLLPRIPFCFLLSPFSAFPQSSSQISPGFHSSDFFSIC